MSANDYHAHFARKFLDERKPPIKRLRALKGFLGMPVAPIVRLTERWPFLCDGGAFLLRRSLPLEVGNHPAQSLCRWPISWPF